MSVGPVHGDWEFCWGAGWWFPRRLDGGGAAPVICAAIGIGSAGIGGVICGLVVVGGASAAGGSIGGDGGEWIGEFPYEQTKP